MYDKQVRRRRLTLAAFVVASLLLLTAYFGEGSGGGLHSLQRGALSVLGPIQEGAHRALKPVRDLFGWVGDTFEAKKERDQLAEENEELTRRVTELEAEEGENEQLKELLRINEAGMDAYDPVPAIVYARSPGLFDSKVSIDKGTSEGVLEGQPVITGLGLVGRVTQATAGYSEVTLVTDESFNTGAKVLAGPGDEQQTTVRASNRPGELELLNVRNAEKVSRGDKVVTTGSTSARFPSFYPRQVLIGTVSEIELGEGSLDSRVRVRPAVDLDNIEWVEVLTGVDRVGGG